MQRPDIERLARAMAGSRSRRHAIALAVSAVVFTRAETNGAKKGRKNRDKPRKRNKSRKQGNSSGNEAFPRDCKRFVISAGSGRDDKFRHIDDDLLIELIPKGKQGGAKVIFNDDNDSPNGNNGAHLKVSPFTARVGDRLRIVARNEEVVGCELDEIWLHCIEGKGGKVRLNERITPTDCRRDEDQVGIFFEKTLRIRNT